MYNKRHHPHSEPVSCTRFSTSTWQSRWTSLGRSTISMPKCTSSWMWRPESWSRATANWFWTIGQPSRRSWGTTRVYRVWIVYLGKVIVCTLKSFYLFLIFSADWQKRWSSCRHRWRSCNIRWRSWSWSLLRLRSLHTEGGGHLAALRVCPVWQS